MPKTLLDAGMMKEYTVEYIDRNGHWYGESARDLASAVRMCEDCRITQSTLGNRPMMIYGPLGKQYNVDGTRRD